MLNAFFGLYRSIDAGCGRSYHSELAIIQYTSRECCVPAAVAGSDGLLAPSVAGLETLEAVKGLLLRRASDCLLVGDRERRSKREDRLTSGSVWSKRDRFELLRSSSAMLIVFEEDNCVTCFPEIAFGGISKCCEKIT